MNNERMDPNQDILRLSAQVTSLEQSLKTLQQAYDNLEREFKERTAELETANAKLKKEIAEHRLSKEMMAKRAKELETVARVSVGVSTLLNTTELLQAVVDLTKNNFELYQVHIYLLDKDGVALKLAAGSGEVGRRMVAEDWQIPVTQLRSLVARATRTRTGVMVNDVRKSPDWLPNPRLPDTRSELAVPMIVGEQVLGVLDVQSDVVDRFTKEDTHIQTTLAAQVAVALQNAKLYEQAHVRVQYETLAREIDAKISRSMDTSTILKTTARELSQALGASHAVIRIGALPDQDIT